jgi:hypothetical protein
MVRTPEHFGAGDKWWADPLLGAFRAQRRICLPTRPLFPVKESQVSQENEEGSKCPKARCGPFLLGEIKASPEGPWLGHGNGVPA